MSVNKFNGKKSIFIILTFILSNKSVQKKKKKSQRDTQRTPACVVTAKRSTRGILKTKN